MINVEAIKKNIDWSVVDKEKAEFIYNEAIIAHEDLVDSLNVLNSKAFQLLSFCIPAITLVISFLFANWNKLENNVQITGLWFICILLCGIISLIIVVWPRDVRYKTGTPESYFYGNIYKHPIDEILKGNILAKIDDFEWNSKIQKIRSLWLKKGFIFIMAAIIGAILIFFLF